MTSVNNVFTQGGPQFGQFRSGVVAELTGLEISAVAGGLAALVVVLGVAALVPAIRRYEIPSALHEEHGGAPARAAV